LRDEILTGYSMDKTYQNTIPAASFRRI